MKFKDTYFWFKNGKKLEILLPILIGIPTVLLAESAFLVYLLVAQGYILTNFACKKIANTLLNKQYLSMSNEEKIVYIEDAISKFNTYIPKLESKETKKATIVRDLQKELFSLKGNIQGEIIPELSPLEKDLQESITFFKRRTQELSDALPKDKYGDNMLYCKTLLKKIYFLISLVEDKPETKEYVNKIFELYIPEIINICENIPHKKADIFVSYMKNLNKILCQLNSLVDTLTDKVLNFTDQDIEASFSVLMREMKNDENM